jgi:hypothetical protein
MSRGGLQIPARPATKLNDVQSLVHHNARRNETVEEKPVNFLFDDKTGLGWFGYRSSFAFAGLLLLRREKSSKVRGGGFLAIDF